MCSKSWLAISSYLQLGSRHTIPPRCIKMTNPNFTFFLPVSKETIMSAPQTSIPNRTPLPTRLPSSKKKKKKSTVVFSTIGVTSYFLVYMKHWSSIISFLVFLRAPDINCLFPAYNLLAGSGPSPSLTYCWEAWSHSFSPVLDPSLTQALKTSRGLDCNRQCSED